MDFDDWGEAGEAGGDFDDWGEAGDDGRGEWSELLGPPSDDRSLSEIGAAQWDAAFSEGAADGQLSGDMVDALAGLGDADLDFDAEGPPWIVDVTTDAPDGDTP